MNSDHYQNQEKNGQIKPWIFIFVVCCCLATKLCPTLCDPTDCSLPGSSVRGISQARILECITISSSRASSWTREWTHISCLAGRFFTTEPPGKSHLRSYHLIRPTFCKNLEGEMLWILFNLNHTQCFSLNRASELDCSEKASLKPSWEVWVKNPVDG